MKSKRLLSVIWWFSKGCRGMSRWIWRRTNGGEAVVVNQEVGLPELGKTVSEHIKNDYEILAYRSSLHRPRLIWPIALDLEVAEREGGCGG